MINRIYVYVAFAICISLSSLSYSQNYYWASRVGSPGHSFTQHLKTDKDGNSYVAGFFSGTVTLGTSTISTANTNTLAQLITKIDSSGNYLWAQSIPGGNQLTQEGNIRDLAIDYQSNVYVTGILDNFPVTIGTTTINSSAPYQYYVVKYDKDGNFQWVIHDDVSKIQNPSLGTDPFGNINLAFSFSSTVSVGGNTYTSSLGGTSYSLLQIQYDNNGTINWVDQLNFTSVNSAFPGHVQPFGVDTDSMGGVYVVGEYSHGILVFGPDSMDNLNDSSDYFIVKRDVNGAIQWSDVSIGSGHQIPVGISVSGDQHIYVTGSFDQSTTFGSTNLSPGPMFFDYFLLKYDTQGNMKWATSGGGSGIRKILGITSDYKDPFVIGFYAYTLVLGGQTFATPSNGAHVLIVKHDSSGQFVWAQQAGFSPNTFASNIGFEIDNDNKGNLYISTTSNHNIVFGNIVVPAVNNTDRGVVARLADTTFVPQSFPPDSVWPGDANYDLIAHNADFLAVGIGYGTTGQPRPNASNNWIAQPSYNWPQTLANGVNYKHLDCNGDGVVDIQDTVAISLNYGLTHAKNEGVEEVGPLLYTNFEEDTIMVGDTIDVTINLGTDTMPANMVYGLAFTLNLDTSLVDPNSFKFSYNTSWLGTKGTDMMGMYKNFPADGKADIALTRINQVNQSGFGEIARFSIIIIDDITAKKYFTETLKITISNQYVIGIDEANIPISLGADSIIIVQEDTSGTGNTSIDSELAKKVKIYPNPAENLLTIEVNELITQGYELRDQLGRLINKTQKRFIKEQLSLQGLSSGIYFLTIHTETGKIVKKLFKH